MQIYRQHAACSYELFSEPCIDAGGERAAGRRKIETETGHAGSVPCVLSHQLQREIELRNCCTGIKNVSLKLET